MAIKRCPELGLHILGAKSLAVGAVWRGSVLSAWRDQMPGHVALVAGLNRKLKDALRHQEIALYAEMCVDAEVQ